VERSIPGLAPSPPRALLIVMHLLAAVVAIPSHRPPLAPETIDLSSTRHEGEEPKWKCMFMRSCAATA
jgi:hypothetical protein